MSISYQVTLRDIYRRAGKYRHQEVVEKKLTPTAFQDAKYVALLHYSAEVDWLTMECRVLPMPSRSGDPIPFRGTFQELDAISRQFKVPDLAQLIGGEDARKYFERRRLLVCGLERGSSIELTFEIDTNAKRFVDAALASAAEGKDSLVVPIDVLLYSGLESFSADEGQITLTLRPVEALPAFQGSLAMDLGNNSSMVVALPQGGFASDHLRVLRPSQRLVRGTLTAQTDPWHSAVRIDKIVSWQAKGEAELRDDSVRIYPTRHHDDFPQSAEWVTGPLAAVGSLESTFTDSKRRMAGANWEETHQIRAQHERQDRRRPEIEPDELIEVLNRTPAELLICRLLQEFSRADSDGDRKPAGWPRYLALTYPTTYAPHEIDRLRRTVYRAWLRMQFKRQRANPTNTATAHPQAGSQQSSAPTSSERDPLARIVAELQRRLTKKRRSDTGLEDKDPLIRLMIDEASAAAFFHLYKLILEEPGALATLPYHFGERGMNLLLYDCGGGTTDIALVTGYVPSDGGITRLNVKVRGRTGLRHFGGDDITRAVCVLIKAKLACVIAAAADEETLRPPSPSDADDSFDQRLRAFLTQASERFDSDTGYQYVPTRFERFQFDDGTNRRRAHTAQLWAWGEELKHRLEDLEEVTLGDLSVSITPALGGLAERLFDRCEGEFDRIEELVEAIKKISISRREIDSLIRDRVARSVRNCNQLIREKLISPDEDGTEEMVHHVVASGNGSRYPLIREMLKRDLLIHNLDQEGRFIHETENLKTAVAKGAAIALAMKRGQGTVNIHFDTELSECLPFDVGYKHVSLNRFITVFEQQERYDTLGSRPVPQKALFASDQIRQAQGTGLNEFTLLRRFPGDAPPPEEAVTEPGEGWEPFLTFSFKNEIIGDLKVSYNQEEHQFAVEDSASQEGVPRELGPAEGHLSPTQRGDL